MTKSKRIIILLTAIVLVVSTGLINVSAYENQTDEVGHSVSIETFEDDLLSNATAVFHIVEIPEGYTELEKQEAIKDAFESITASEANTPFTGMVDTLVIRSGNTTDCELYFTWACNYSVSAFAFSNYTIKSTDILFPSTYVSTGTQTWYFNTSSSGTKKIADFNIPTGVTKVKAYISSPKLYVNIFAEWYSGLSISDLVTIN